MKTEHDIEEYVLTNHSDPVDIRIVTTRSEDLIRDLAVIACKTLVEAKMQGKVVSDHTLDLCRKVVIESLESILWKKEK